MRSDSLCASPRERLACDSVRCAVSCCHARESSAKALRKRPEKLHSLTWSTSLWSEVFDASCLLCWSGALQGSRERLLAHAHAGQGSGQGSARAPQRHSRPVLHCVSRERLASCSAEHADAQRFIVRLASRASCLRFGPLCHAAMLASAKALRERPSQEQRRFARRRRGAVPVPSSQRNCMILASACILSHTHSRALRAACMHVSASARCMHANASARALRYAPCMHMRLAGA